MNSLRHVRSTVDLRPADSAVALVEKADLVNVGLVIVDLDESVDAAEKVAAVRLRPKNSLPG